MTKKKSFRKSLLSAYRRALRLIGPRHWWPGETPFEIMVGAILTQNTAWRNVEKAIQNLKEHNLLSPQALDDLPQEKLASLIRSSGYFNMKAKKIKAFVEFYLREYQASIKKMRREDMQVLRKKLLAVHGIGPETADSILLYAAEKPSFVVDAYTRRIFSRHQLFKENVTYDEMRDFFMENLDPDQVLYNEYHALIVHIGHHHCRTKPLCEKCPWNWIRFPNPRC